MIGATSIGWVGAFLPDETVAQIFAGGHIPGAAGIGGVWAAPYRSRAATC